MELTGLPPLNPGLIPDKIPRISDRSSAEPSQKTQQLQTPGHNQILE